MPDKPLAKDDPAQSQRFINMATEVGSEGDAVRFEKTLAELLLHTTAAQKDKGKGAKGGT